MRHERELVRARVQDVREGRPLALPTTFKNTAPGLPALAEKELEQRPTVPAVTWLVLCSIKIQSQNPDHTCKQSDVQCTKVCFKREARVCKNSGSTLDGFQVSGLCPGRECIDGPHHVLKEFVIGSCLVRNRRNLFFNGTPDIPRLKPLDLGSIDILEEGVQQQL